MRPAPKVIITCAVTGPIHTAVYAPVGEELFATP
jgi:hypothetical protein